MSTRAAAMNILDHLHAISTAEPDRPAFRLTGAHGSVLLTYGGLADRVQRLGTALRAAGFGDGEHVALCLENRPAWPIAYLAAWYAGAATVPIDSMLEPHAVRRVLAHSGARVCLTSRALADKVLEACNGLDSPVLLLDVDADGDRRWDGDAQGEGVPQAEHPAFGTGWSEFVDLHAGNVAGAWSPHLDLDATATIMYTSGTTGSPKGVVLGHRAIALNVDNGLRRIRVTRDDRILAVLPMFHALPLTTNCLGPVQMGAEVVFLADLNPDHIIAAFRQHDITVFACVPLFFYRFHDRVMARIAALPAARRRIARAMLGLNRFTRKRLGINLGPRLFRPVHEPFGSLRLFISGGAKFNPQVYQDFVDLGFSLVQGYGLTEGTAGLTAHPIDELRADTVGTALDGIQLRIAHPDDEGIGEIQALTPSRMTGYYKNPEATAEAFDGEWLKTGDLGRLLPDGHLQVTGRAKDVIVLASGKNIYPEELEAFYGQSPFIAEICILGVDDPQRRGAERLHAVVVPDLEHARAAGHVNIREMVKWELDGLGVQLPGPQRVTSLEIRSEPLPRTTTRKIKRFELKRDILERGLRPEGAAGTDAGLDAGPAPTEETETEAWAVELREVIARHAKVERVRRAQHLDLDLGLESLDRIELQAEIEGLFGIVLPPERAAAVQTVGDLIDLVSEQAGQGIQAPAESVDRWHRVLSEPPPDIEPYLQRRPVGETLVRGVLVLLRGVLRLGGYRVAGREHLEREAPFILAPNHLSYVDPFLLSAALPSRVLRNLFYVGYSAYFRGRLLGWVGKVLRTVPIDQNRHLEGALKAAAEGLRRGMVLGIFPEGGRSSDGTVQEFRRGAGILAREMEVPVIPVGIWGTYEMWPREGRFRLHPTAIVFGEPMRLAKGADRAEEDRFMERLRERVIALADEARRLHEG